MENNKWLLRKESHIKLVEKLLEGYPVYGPVQHGNRTGYQRIIAFNDLAEDYIIPDLSAKSFVFPKVEKLFGYNRSKNDITLESIHPESFPHKIIIGMRPCDASGIECLKAVFEQEPSDPVFLKRLERCTFITYSCNRADDYCFCTSMDGGPGSTVGSDILLTRMDTGDFIAEIITPKGQAIFETIPGLFEKTDNPDKDKYLANVPKRLDESLEDKIKAAFDTIAFDEYAMRCLGCSACAFVCAFVCPTCSCFDIQDEKKGSKGQRIRCWDSCGTKLFTLHTSGHNPRETQGARWRQRLMHKFSYMPEQFNLRGCVGCGRCSRRCPVDMNMVESLSIICK